MITYVLFNKDTATERVAEELCAQINKEEVDAQLLDADSPRGIQLAENYDVLGRPAVLLIKNDGVPMKIWQGESELPSPTEVAYLARQ